MNTLPKKEVSGGSQEFDSRLVAVEMKLREHIEEELRKRREVVERVAKMEERLARMEGFLSNMVGSAMPKIEKLLALHSPHQAERHVNPSIPTPTVPSSTTPVSTPITSSPIGVQTSSSVPQSLHEVAERGDAQSLRLILADGGHVDARDASGYTALHVAARRGHVDAVEALIEGGARVGTRGPLLRTPLHLAAEEGHENVVRRLVELGAALDQPDAQSDTPLALAATRGKTAVLKVLLQLGAALNIDKVIWAAEKGSSEVFRILLKTSIGPEDLERCLLVAGNADVVWSLLDDDRISVTTDLGERAISEALSKGRMSALEALVRAGFRSPAALYTAAKGGDAASLRVFLREGCDVNEKFDGRYALHIAAFNAHEECVRLLLDGGADIKTTNFKGSSALHCAANGGATQCVQMLLEAGADSRAINDEGWTPLHYASQEGAMQCARLLIDAGSDINALTKSGRTPLKVASTKGHDDIVSFLREKGGR